MTEGEFVPQIDRLRSTWPSSFHDEKIKIIYGTVRDLGRHWFERLVTHLIATSKSAPLPVDFANAVQIELKSRRSAPMLENVHPSENSIFSKEEIAEHFRVMKGAIKGSISKEDVQKYIDAVQSAIDSARRTGRRVS